MSNTTTIGALDALRAEITSIRERLAAIEGTPAVKAHAHELARVARVRDYLAIGNLPTADAIERIAAMTHAARWECFAMLGHQAVPIVSAALEEHPDWLEQMPPALQTAVWLAAHAVPPTYRVHARRGLVWTRSKFAVTARVAQVMRAAGIDATHDGHEWTVSPRSWSTGDSEHYTAERLECLRSHDREFAAALAEGRLVAVECSVEDSTAALLASIDRRPVSMWPKLARRAG